MKKICIFIICCMFLSACSIKTNTKISDSESKETEVANSTNKVISNEGKINIPDTKLMEEAKRISNNFLVSEVTQYDVNGNIVSLTKYKYDEQFRCIEESYDLRDINYSYIGIYSYNHSNGRLEKIHYVEDKNAKTTGDWTEYTYDSLGNSTAITYSDGKLSTKFIYNDKKQIIERFIYSDGGITHEVNSYNEYGDLESWISTKQKDDGSIKEWTGTNTFEYNKYGLKVRMENVNGTSYSIYEYDDNYCLKSEKSYSSFSQKNTPELIEYKYINKSDITVNFKGEIEASETVKKDQQNDLSEEKLVSIAREKLGVPDNSNITYKFDGEKHFWESGQVYNIRIDFYEDGTFVASTFINTENGELTHGIMSYTPPESY